MVKTRSSKPEFFREIKFRSLPGDSGFLHFRASHQNSRASASYVADASGLSLERAVKICAGSKSLEPKETAHILVGVAISEK